MKIDLREYIDRRERQKKLMQEPGPVITISRDFGCRANEIARQLIGKVSRLAGGRLKPQPWKILNKEFLAEAAQELHLRPYQVEHVLTPHEKSLLEDFINSYSSEYVDDRRILKSIKNLVLSYAQEGNLIIVGRAGMTATHHIERSFHIKLEAPLSWRVEHLMQSQELDARSATDLAHQMDEQRRRFIKQMSHNSPEDMLFDVTFNRATISTEAIVKSIITLVNSKRICSLEIEHSN